MHYEVKTISHVDGRIEQVITNGPPGVFTSMGIRAEIYRAVIDTQDAQVREALIQLGWTPPKDK